MIEVLRSLILGSIELTILFAAALAVERLVAGRRPRLAAVVWLIVMIRAIATLFVPAPFSIAVPGVHAASLAPAAVVSETIVGINGPSGERAEVVREVEPARWSGLLALLWCAGAVIMLARLLRDHRRIARLVGTSRPVTDRTRAAAASAARDVGLRILPVIRVSDAMEGPAVVGWIHPVVLLPSWLEEEASESDLCWTLRHELMHVRTLDTTAGLVPAICRAVYWFHPLSWIAWRRWERLVERACDRAILHASPDPLDYANTLYRLLMRVRSAPSHAAGLFAVRSSIGQRIETLLRTDRPVARLGVLGTVAAFVLTAPLFLVGATWKDTTSYFRVGQIEEVRNGVVRTLDYRGRFHRAADGAIESMDGIMTLEEKRAGLSRRLRIEGDGRKLERTYSRNGRPAAWDYDARWWEASMLREID